MGKTRTMEEVKALGRRFSLPPIQKALSFGLGKKAGSFRLKRRR